MTNLIKRFFFYRNRPIHELTAEDIAEAEAMEQLLVKIRALDFEYDLPDFYCIF